MLKIIIARDRYMVSFTIAVLTYTIKIIDATKINMSKKYKVI